MRKRRKVGTVLDEGLYRRTRMVAAAQGKQISQVLSEALALYLADNGAPAPTDSVVADTWGVLSLDPAQVRTIMEDEDGFRGT